MNANACANANLLLGWIWLFLAFLTGLGLGLFFHRENWLGGYGSLQRRMYRLAHISFFGLGAVNLLFWLTVRFAGLPSGPVLNSASLLFLLGAVTMPLCCVLMPHVKAARWLFGVPVIALLVAGALTISMVSHSTQAPHQPLNAHVEPEGVVWPNITGCILDL